MTAGPWILFLSILCENALPDQKFNRRTELGRLRFMSRATMALISGTEGVFSSPELLIMDVNRDFQHITMVSIWRVHRERSQIEKVSCS